MSRAQLLKLKTDSGHLLGIYVHVLILYYLSRTLLNVISRSIGLREGSCYSLIPRPHKYMYSAWE